jgi:hypothetical protein
LENAKAILGAFIGIIFLLDVILAGGNFLIGPALNLIFYQNLDGTFWQCEHWIVMDEGQFCGDE